VRPINDHTLIEIMQEGGSSVFFFTIVLTAAVLTLAWGAVMEGFVRFKTPFGFTTAEYNIADLAKEIRKTNAGIAIVGSSLSKRLDSSLFANTNVMNLSVGGGSVMTGLEILNSAPTFPKVIIVEINILDRPVDEEWKNKGIAAAQVRPWAVLSGVSKPLRYLLTSPLFSYIPPEQQAAWWNSKRILSRSQETATYDIQSVVSAGQISWSQRNGWDIASRNIKRIQDLILKFESRGAKVYLLYLPFADGYDDHEYAQRNREIASGNNAFMCERCIDVRRLVAVGDLRWADGAHLDDKSALIVSEALEKYILSIL